MLMLIVRNTHYANWVNQKGRIHKAVIGKHGVAYLTKPILRIRHTDHPFQKTKTGKSHSAQ